MLAKKLIKWLIFIWLCCIPAALFPFFVPIIGTAGIVGIVFIVIKYNKWVKSRSLDFDIDKNKIKEYISYASKSKNIDYISNIECSMNDKFMSGEIDLNKWIDFSMSMYPIMSLWSEINKKIKIEKRYFYNSHYAILDNVFKKSVEILGKKFSTNGNIENDDSKDGSVYDLYSKSVFHLEKWKNTMRAILRKREQERFCSDFKNLSNS